MNDRPKSYVVIDARAKQVFAPHPPFTMLGVMALDLPCNLWRDFLFFIDEARAAEETGVAERRYRCLRVSLLCLFAHLNAFFDMLIQSRKQDAAFQDYKRREVPSRKSSQDWPRCEHGQFVVLYTDFIKSSQALTLPAIDWSIKPLRNLLAHPNGVRDITVADLYNLDVGALLAAAVSFQSWIVEACKLCSIQYEIDTAGVVSQFTASLTDQPCDPERF